MAIGEVLLADIRGLHRRPSDWFSVAEIERRDPDLKVAARYVRSGTGEELVVPRDGRQIHDQLEVWAARLLEQEVRSYEERLWEFCSENSIVPSIHDDTLLTDDLIQYIDASVKEIEGAIGQYTH